MTDFLKHTAILAISFMFLLLVCPVGNSSGFGKSMGAGSRPAQRRSLVKKPTRQKLASVESSCFKGILNSFALRLPLIAYPREAWRRRIGGKVTIKVFVNESGSVYHAEVVDGPALLRKATLISARGAEFSPFTKDEKPIKCAGLLVYQFNPPE